MDITLYRNAGPKGLQTYLRNHGAHPSRDLDRICAQHQAHTTLLYWFTDIDAAKPEATRTKRPILSLRLLGRLDEDLSCANSRFFRMLLYPMPTIRRMLQKEFVLHWQSVRPVPKVKIDLGEGRVLERTLTGNSLHAILDERGRPLDAILGLMRPDAFVQALARAKDVHPDRVAQAHASRTFADAESFQTRAMRASLMAPTKHAVEMPLLSNVMPRTIEEDTHIAETDLHPRLSRAFTSPPWRDADEMVSWIYRELFQMPPEDPWLGLAAKDAFNAIENDGLIDAAVASA